MSPTSSLRGLAVNAINEEFRADWTGPNKVVVALGQGGIIPFCDVAAEGRLEFLKDV